MNRIEQILRDRIAELTADNERLRDQLQKARKRETELHQIINEWKSLYKDTK